MNACTQCYADVTDKMGVFQMLPITLSVYAGSHVLSLHMCGIFSLPTLDMLRTI